MLVERIKKKIELGEKIYWVCPLVEESEKLEYIDVSTRAQEIEKVIDKAKIGVLHGKMDNKEKDIIMEQFKNNEIQILISTTVIEVGVDVKNATFILNVEDSNSSAKFLIDLLNISLSSRDLTL